MARNTTTHDALFDERLKDHPGPQDMLGAHGLRRQLTKRLVARALEAELTDHLGYAPHARNGSSPGNCRHGQSTKTVHTETAQFDIELPRDRDSSCEPQLVQTRQRRLEGCDEKVLALYARGLSPRAIQAHLEELYGGEVSPTLISNVTDAVLDEGRTGQGRPRAAVYPILYCEALFVKTRQEGPVQTKAVSVALGVTVEGEKELLGVWLSETEGAPCWLSGLTDLKNRGVEDCCIACGEGRKGVPEAMEAVCPKTQGQRCSVQKVRNSLKYIPWKARQTVATDLRALSAATTLA